MCDATQIGLRSIGEKGSVMGHAHQLGPVLR